MSREKDSYKIPKGNFAGIKIDFDDFGMPCATIANLFVGGIFGAAASIARDDRFYAAQLIKHRLRAPKTAAAEYGDSRLRIVHRFPPNFGLIPCCREKLHSRRRHPPVTM
jgi:hypothetical protein